MAVQIRSTLVTFKPQLMEEEHRPDDRPLLPADGTVVHLETHVSVFCASCERWIDCHGGIEPMVALDRHAGLIH